MAASDTHFLKTMTDGPPAAGGGGSGAKRRGACGRFGGPCGVIYRHAEPRPRPTGYAGAAHAGAGATGGRRMGKR